MTEYYAIGDYACSVSDRTLCSASPATQTPIGDCWPWGGAREELLDATLYGTAGRRPNRGCGPRAVAEATRHNVTKPHRPRTNRDAGRERASGAAGRSTRQAGASTSRRGLGWSRGPQVDRIEVRYWSSHADVGREEQPSVCIQPQITHVNHYRNCRQFDRC